MSNVIPLTRSAPVTPDDPMHDPGDVVLVSDGDRQYYAKVVGRTRAGAYVVDPIRPEADARAADVRHAA